MPARPTIDTSALGRVRGQSSERVNISGSPKVGPNQSPSTRDIVHETESPASNGRRTPTQHAARAGSRQDTHGTNPGTKPTWAVKSPTGTENQAELLAKTPIPQQTSPRQIASQQTIPQQTVSQQTSPQQAAPHQVVPQQATLHQITPRPASPPPPTRQPSNPLSRRSSGRNSQTVVLLKELDSARNRNAWYASELELARKAGYMPSTSNNSLLDSKAMETFDDEDRPLIEALLAMRTELANVQTAVDKQAVVAAKHVAEAERQRDAAIQEAVYSKAKLAAHFGGSAAGTPQFDHGRDDSEARSIELGRKLAGALHLHKDLESKLESAKSDLESEKRARQLADETSTAAQRRMTDLEAYKQQTSTEVERLKAELHVAQHEVREQSTACTEAIAALELLRIEKNDLDGKFQEAVGNSKDHEDTFEALRASIISSEDSKTLVETKLGQERAQREKLDAQLSKLKAEHEARTAELVATTQRLRDAEELSQQHAVEARTHRQAVLAGLEKISARDLANVGKGDTERTAALQAQVAASTELVKKYQQEADTSAEKLRAAEERIAGLEQYQEQSSREGVGIRRQLQSALRDTQSLQALNSDLKNQFAAQQLETNAMTVQYNALKDILSERGISPTGAIRARGLASPRTNSPDVSRVRDLEAQLTSATAAHEESKQIFTIQAQESETAYREKLSQLESDYQSAVHYVKGTEKMLKQMKDQLSHYKTENGQLKSEIEELEDRLQADSERSAVSGDWENEKARLEASVEDLQEDLQQSRAEMEQNINALRAELSDNRQQLDRVSKSNEETTQKFNSHRKDLEQLQSENALLEQRANDAEQKVALLLDQVEHSVDNYRRRSRQAPSLNSELTPGVNGLGFGHSRNESSEGESIYGGNVSNSNSDVNQVHGNNSGSSANNNNKDLEARDSAALDSLATELETLRSQWEATNKNYRLSTNFDFESTSSAKKDDYGTSGIGLSESLADWRKRLDTEEHQGNGDKNRRI